MTSILVSDSDTSGSSGNTESEINHPPFVLPFETIGELCGVLGNLIETPNQESKSARIEYEDAH